MKNNRKMSIILGIVIFLFLFAICLPAIVGLITERLWYIDLGYLEVFSKRIVQQILTGSIAGLVAFAFVSFNLYKAGKVGQSVFNNKFIIPVTGVLVGMFTGVIAKDFWMSLQQFLSAVDFNISDPILNQDIAFYLFKLPFLKDFHSFLSTLVIITLIILIFKYITSMSKDIFVKEDMNYEGPINYKTPRYKVKFNLKNIDKRILSHVGSLIGMLFFLGAIGYVFRIFNLMYSSNGVAFGASYTDVKATLTALKIMAAITLLCSASTLIAALRHKIKPLLITLGAFIIASVAALGIYPGVVQKFYVEPNEFEAETQYIEYNLEFTRTAYGLNDVEEREFDYSGELTLKELEENSQTVDNIRLWDWEPLLTTYSQLQEMRLYYKFNDIDIDRYVIDGQDKQLMLAAREMDVDQLPQQAQNWINRHLKYTHGYGVVASSVSEVGTDGLPKLLLQDIPPKGSAELRIDRPQIYFGELTNDYVIVDTNTDEFDYPIGDSNAYNRYEGEPGIKLSNFFRKVAFSIKFSTMKMLLSSDVTSDSKILYDRSISARVKKIAPFLTYDEDPYIVIADGRLVWIYDAYTTSDMYPYSQPIYLNGKQINYIRNSVKVTVDAYTGETTFYISDPDDPVVMVYAKIFPGLFVSIDTMPDAIKEHIRYPEDFFKVQSDIYMTYHMKDPSVFYNKEDYWNIPNEIYGSAKAELAPYYVNMKLPSGDDNMEFVLIMPYTPASKDNMVAWMAARSDGDNYGELVLYKFTKQRMIYGPMQVEAQIDQDKEISQLLSLLNQQGSKVLRGNMIVYPIADSFIYVEPLFMAAERSQLPQLKLVIVSDGTKVTYGDNLEEALLNLFEGYTPPTGQPIYLGDTAGLAEMALELYKQSYDSLSRGNWTEYGELQTQLENVLVQMVESE